MSPLRILARLMRVYPAYKRRADVLPYMPIRLWVESTNCCNLRCPMCPNKDMPAGDKAVMKFELFEKIVREAGPFASDMYLHHRGEPLINPRLFDMIRLAHDAGLRTRMHSNATLLDAEKAEKMAESGLDLVSFSVDGFDKRTYESIRRGGNFEQTVANIEGLARARSRLGRRTPYIVVEKIMFRNPEVPPDAVKAEELKRRFLAAGVNEVIEKEEYNWAVEEAPPPTGPRTCSVCTFPWYAMVICADGTVTPCPQDFWAKLDLGNVKDQTIAEIWNGPAYRALRRSYRDEATLAPLCAKCDRLYRKTVGGVPFQYMITFLTDQLVGYGALRRRLGTAERN